MRKFFVWAVMVYLLVDCQSGPATSSTQILTMQTHTDIVEAATSTPHAMPTKTTPTVPIQTIIPAKPTPSATSLALPIRSVTGDLMNQIERLEESMPTANSHAYGPPSTAEMETFREIVAGIINGKAESAVDLAAANRDEILRYADRGDRDQESFLLRELRPIQNGWGLVAIRIGPSKDVIIEVPHPLSDEKTPVIALQAYRALEAHALLIAGANRYANNDGTADVAHNPQTIFQSVHQSLLERNSPVVLQIHGFASNNHPGYPHVVLGNDQGAQTFLIQQLADALTASNVSVGICNKGKWHDLCGETNVQSSSMGAGVFIHIELDEMIRSNVDPLIEALAQVFNP